MEGTGCVGKKQRSQAFIRAYQYYGAFIHINCQSDVLLGDGRREVIRWISSIILPIDTGRATAAVAAGGINSSKCACLHCLLGHVSKSLGVLPQAFRPWGPQF